MDDDAVRVERCGTCRFWRGKDVTPKQEEEGYDASLHDGRCQRYPPALNQAVVHGEATEHAEKSNSYVDEAIERTPFTWVWFHPTTQHDNWCGEWQPKPEV